MVQHKITKKPYALKCLSKAGIIKHSLQVGQHRTALARAHVTTLQEHTIRERQLLRKLNHPFVLKLHGAMQDSRYIYFVLQLLIGGELFTHLERKGALKEKEARFYAAQVSTAPSPPPPCA
jgi:serine/threonine protein kinase